MDLANTLVSTMVTLIVAVIASSGFWAYLQKRDTAKNATTRLLLGLAHDRIIFLGMKYIEQGYISKDEYEDLLKYLWTPYSEFGGNGLAEKIMADVTKLPMVGSNPTIIPVTEEKNGQQHNTHGHRRGDPVVEQPNI